MIVIITTIHQKTDAHKIGKGLLKDKLIVCYNLFPIESAFWWKGKIEEGVESLVIMKTKKTNFNKIEEYIKKYSGYEVPEVIALNVVEVNNSYLKWLNREIE